MGSILTSKDLIEVVFENKQEQIKQFASIGVYFEDTQFSGKLLSLEEIQKKNRTVLQYLGFNFSKSQIVEFVKQSKIKSELFEKILSNTGNFYMISYLKNDTNTRNHEIAHYEYWKHESVQKSIHKMSNSKLYQEIEKELIKLGYSKDVVPTEIYAFRKVYEKTLPHKLNCNLQKIQI